MKIGVICAMQKEYELFYGMLTNRSEVDESCVGNIADKTVCVVVSGIGKANAAATTQRMLDRLGIDEMFSIGVAGAADPYLKPGDIVIGNSYCYHDVWCGKPNMPGQVQGLPAVFPSGFGRWIEKIDHSMYVGTIATGDRFVQTREEIEKIKNFLPASHNVIAVDMESAAIAQVCYQNEIPFTSIRIISDNPLNANQEEQYEGFWESMAEKSFEAVMRILK